MNGQPLTEAQISRALRAHLPQIAQPGLRELVLDATRITRQERPLPSFLGALSDADPVSRRRNMLIAAAVLVALAFATAAAAGAWRLFQGDPVIELTREATPRPEPSATPEDRRSPTPRPSATPKPLAWTQASLEEDWPAPVRAEPAGGATVQPTLLNVERDQYGRYLDAIGEAGPDAIPWVDIEMVSFCGPRCVQVWVPSPPPSVNPTEAWIAYGLVADDDGDGHADRRFGVDNAPEATAGTRQYRTWFTDLHTGRTQWVVGDPYCLGDCTLSGAAYPVATAITPTGEACAARSAVFSFFGGDIAGGGTHGKIPAPFYTWAAVIDGGRVVATDYAPDTGWLQPSAKAPPTAPHQGVPWSCPPAIGTLGGER